MSAHPEFLQQDAFPEALVPRPPERRKPEYRVLDPPTRERVSAEPLELWLGVHLPQLTEVDPVPCEPGEAHRRRRLLERLDTRAQHFTPRVSLAPPDGLLLEIKGSVRLFSGVENLCRLIEKEHHTAQVPSVLAVAPTPLAALARARVHHEPPILDRARLIGGVATLPFSALRWPSEVIARLAKTGVYTVGQALRLPRAGFARRFGAAQLLSLDRLTGRSADPRTRFLPRERFRRIRELPYEIESHEALLQALHPLLSDMEKFLRARQAGITRLECRFRHRHAADTPCVLQLAAPAADAKRLGVLLGERLASLSLPEPVRSCEVRTDVVAPIAPVREPLWQPGEHGGEGAVECAQLIEHLRARLSAHAVHGLRLAPDHRPESASRSVEPGLSPVLATAPESLKPRPLWLLGSPQLLAERAGWPWHHGPLELAATLAMERIEAACWDGEGGEIARDYYAAIDSRNVRLWIFRERTAPHRWFLHGLFG